MPYTHTRRDRIKDFEAIIGDSTLGIHALEAKKDHITMLGLTEDNQIEQYCMIEEECRTWAKPV